MGFGRRAGADGGSGPPEEDALVVVRGEVDRVDIYYSVGGAFWAGS